MSEQFTLEMYEAVPTLEKAKRILKVWTDKGFDAPNNVLGYSPIFIEQALGYLELIINNPDSERIESYFVMATNLIMLWNLLPAHPPVKS